MALAGLPMLGPGSRVFETLTPLQGYVNDDKIEHDSTRTFYAKISRARRHRERFDVARGTKGSLSGRGVQSEPGVSLFLFFGFDRRAARPSRGPVKLPNDSLLPSHRVACCKPAAKQASHNQRGVFGARPFVRSRTLRREGICINRLSFSIDVHAIAHKESGVDCEMHVRQMQSEQGGVLDMRVVRRVSLPVRFAAANNSGNGPDVRAPGARVG